MILQRFGVYGRVTVRGCFESLSPEVYSSIYAHESRIENWRRQEDLVSIWAKIVEIYSAGEVIFPELWKIDALAFCIGKEETLSS